MNRKFRFSAVVIFAILFAACGIAASGIFGGEPLHSSISRIFGLDPKPANEFSHGRQSKTSHPPVKTLHASLSGSPVDEQLHESLAADSYEACTDEVYLRRVYLRLAGRIPTLSEAKRFLESDAEEKRSELVDELLESKAYVSNFFNFWADLLRIQSRNRTGPAKPYLDFVKSAITNNVPYDDFVFQLLTASGPFFEKGNGAVGYLLRDFGMPEDSVSNSVRVFLGTRLGCAQCHDHPSGDWTRKQYYQMVAFNGGLSYYLGETQSEHNDQLDLIDYRDPKNSEIRGPLMNIVAPLHYGVKGSGTGMARLPEDYQYSDGTPLEIVKAKTIFANDSYHLSNLESRRKPIAEVDVETTINQKKLHLIKGASQISSRMTLAHWMTARTNPRFAKVMTNRIWKQAMGRAFFEPVDDLNTNTKVSNQKLLTRVERSFKRSNYDFKGLLRTIFKSKLFQAKLNSEVSNNHVGPTLERMRAEQVWDSLLALTVDDVDRKRSDQSARENFLGLTDIYESYEKIKSMHPNEIKKLVLQIHKSWQEDPTKRIRFYFRLDAEPAKFRMHEYNQPEGVEQLMRASELESPAPPGHFLREFGQSNREQIDNGNREMSATQWLEMMNGFVENEILSNPRSRLMRNVAAAETNDKKIDTVFLSVLTRHPSPAEKSEWLSALKADSDEGAKDLIWTLINSTEFLFVQ